MAVSAKAAWLINKLNNKIPTAAPAILPKYCGLNEIPSNVNAKVTPIEKKRLRLMDNGIATTKAACGRY